MDGMTWVIVSVCAIVVMILFFDKFLPWILNK